ncbi:hypothetical protein KsCSTR_46160 [Candidatus Kuenenia stuttgartiensis]|uniref:Uncharacterized protein n=1 Tax=Kuenenia stuttgartiensis TaxID=174633 RepID=A0A6G7GWV1_KUEST|nr:hypothetical protein KsCSTR_46160 [Candidatus Kuenenia stuttgartiensis]
MFGVTIKGLFRKELKEDNTSKTSFRKRIDFMKLPLIIESWKKG